MPNLPHLMATFAPSQLIYSQFTNKYLKNLSANMFEK